MRRDASQSHENCFQKVPQLAVSHFKSTTGWTSIQSTSSSSPQPLSSSVFRPHLHCRCGSLNSRSHQKLIQEHGAHRLCWNSVCCNGLSMVRVLLTSMSHTSWTVMSFSCWSRCMWHASCSLSVQSFLSWWMSNVLQCVAKIVRKFS